MNDSDLRIARLLQASAVLFASGHCRQDAVRTALDLEAQVIEAVKKTQGDSECQNQRA